MIRLTYVEKDNKADGAGGCPKQASQKSCYKVWRNAENLVAHVIVKRIAPVRWPFLTALYNSQVWDACLLSYLLRVSAVINGAVLCRTNDSDRSGNWSLG